MNALFMQPGESAAVETKYLFIDEAGDLNFSGRGNSSAFFILSSVVADSYRPAIRLMKLRHDLVIEGDYNGHFFHASEDSQSIRDRVFAEIQKLDLRIDATVFEKAKAVEHRREDHKFYELAWYLHMKHVIPSAIHSDDNLIIFVATLNTSKKQADFRKALSGTINDIGGRRGVTKVVYWPAQCEYGIQIADYCGWAIQRKWERGDSRSYDLIAHAIRSEFDCFRRGKKVA